MKVLYMMESDWPKNRRKRKDFSAITWQKLGEIPFIPTVGMMIDTGDGDYRKVDQVFWNVEEPDALTVWLEEQEGEFLFERFEEGGWSTKDLTNG